MSVTLKSTHLCTLSPSCKHEFHYMYTQQDLFDYLTNRALAFWLEVNEVGRKAYRDTDWLVFVNGFERAKWKPLTTTEHIEGTDKMSRYEKKAEWLCQRNGTDIIATPVQLDDKVYGYVFWRKDKI